MTGATAPLPPREGRHPGRRAPAVSVKAKHLPTDDVAKKAEPSVPFDGRPPQDKKEGPATFARVAALA